MEVEILKHGRIYTRLQCDCCGRYVEKLSARDWCLPCEAECTKVGQRVREQLEIMKAYGPTQDSIDGKQA